MTLRRHAHDRPHPQARDRRRQRAGGGVFGVAGGIRSRRRRPVRRRRPPACVPGDAHHGLPRSAGRLARGDAVRRLDVHRRAGESPAIGRSDGGVATAVGQRRATSLRQVRDPLRLQQELGDAGLWFPETTDSPAGLPLDGSWLCKTYRDASGVGVWSLSERRCIGARTTREHAVFQRDVEGTPASAAFVVFEDRAWLLGVTRQRMGSRDTGAGRWRYCGSISMPSISSAVAVQLDQLGDLLASRFQLRGLVGVDLVLADDRAWVIEINPRYSASMEIVERACRRSIVAAHVAACQGALAPLQSDWRPRRVRSDDFWQGDPIRPPGRYRHQRRFSVGRSSEQA